jgi:hypothetical protein
MVLIWVRSLLDGTGVVMYVKPGFPKLSSIGLKLCGRENIVRGFCNVMRVDFCACAQNIL